MAARTDPALARAAHADDLMIAVQLLREGADPDARDAIGYPPLVLAAARGSVPMVELLLSAGADPLLPDTPTGASPLHRAAQSGVVAVARLLLDRGAFIDQQAPANGHTPLIDAVRHRRSGMTVLLLERGADPTRTAHDGGTARYMAEAADDVDLVALLDTALARRAEQESALLRTSALRGDVDGVRRALADGADVNTAAPDGRTPLQDAAREGHAAIVALLLDAGADARVVDARTQVTVGHEVGYAGHADIARLLVQRLGEPGSLELDAQNPYTGHTALHNAVWRGHPEAAQVFLDAGARTDLTGLDGRTPARLARDNGDDALADLIDRRR